MSDNQNLPSLAELASSQRMRQQEAAKNKTDEEKRAEQEVRAKRLKWNAMCNAASQYVQAANASLSSSNVVAGFTSDDIDNGFLLGRSQLTIKRHYDTVLTDIFILECREIGNARFEHRKENGAASYDVFDPITVPDDAVAKLFEQKLRELLQS